MVKEAMKFCSSVCSVCSAILKTSLRNTSLFVVLIAFICIELESILTIYCFLCGP